MVDFFAECSYFTAGMTTTQRSESINRFMDYFMGTQTKLHEFIDAFDKAMDKRAESRIAATTREKVLLPKLCTTFPMEKKASERYSHYAFHKFQKELVLSAEYVFQDGKVSHFQNPDIERSVTYDPDKKLVQCSCRMFESAGFLCRHALRVLNVFTVLELPDSYILKRWEKDLIPTSFHREYIRFQQEEFSGSEVEKWKYKLLLKARSITFYGSTSSSCLRNKIDTELDKLLEMVMNEADMVEGSSIVDKQSTIKTAPGRKRSLQAEEKITSNENSVLVDKALVIEHSGSDSDESGAFMENPPRCKTKGRPKSARAKSGLETINTRQPRLCRSCNLKVVGHDSRNCPQKKKNQPE